MDVIPVSATFLFAPPATAKHWVRWAEYLAPMSGAIAASFLYVKYLA